MYFFALFVLCLRAYLSIATPILVIDFIRHGARSPLALLPFFSNTTWKTPGELTTLGSLQHFSLGKSRRQHYIDTGFLPNKYNSSLIYARSTKCNRTLSSLQSYFLGLYSISSNDSLGSADFYKIHTFSAMEEKLLSLESCPFVIKTMYSFDKTQDYRDLVTQFNSTWNAIIAHYPDITMKYIEKGHNAFLLADYLTCADTEGVKPKGIAAETIKEAKTFLGQALKGMMNYNEQVKKIWIPEFVKEILKLMRNAVEGKSTTRYAVYAGHDTTLTMLLIALQGVNSSIEWNQTPGFASSVLLELEERQVAVYYEGKLIHMEKYETFAEKFDKIVETNKAIRREEICGTIEMNTS
eukprot:TRINITY_DN90389_c0_g1_i1.p1 TRINITY_DN90389_c0_g1~~TRINITY_DN90389_c0_g1_i1.p1  ORF type:complete len:390 (+),score=23.20 TRINITY_DN90389_c0_g1_i1:114-1172(+)